MSAPKPQSKPFSAPSLPCNSDMEDFTLGLILREGAASFAPVADDLCAESFHEPANRAIYLSIATLLREGARIDVVTVAAALDRRVARLQACGGVERLNALAALECPSDALHGYAKELARYAHARRIATAAQKIATIACDMEKADSDKSNETAALLFDALMSQKSDDGGEFIGEVSTRQLASIREIRSSDEAFSGVASGIDKWDEIIMGFRPGTLHIVAARPSMGKSGLLASITLNAAKANHPCILFSLEMSKEAFWMRYASQYTNVSSSKISMPKSLNDFELVSLEEFEKSSQYYPIMKYARHDLTLEDMRRIVRREVMQLEDGHKLPLIAVDFLQLIPRKENRNSTDAEELKKLAYGLRGIGQEFNCPVVALAQLNRNLEKREDKRPIMSDLDGSGGMEQAADSITMIYRPEYYAPPSDIPKDPGEDEEIELIIQKQRNGLRNVSVRCAFKPNTTRFHNLKEGIH